MPLRQVPNGAERGALLHIGWDRIRVQTKGGLAHGGFIPCREQKVWTGPGGVVALDDDHRDPSRFLSICSCKNPARAFSFSKKEV